MSREILDFNRIQGGSGGDTHSQQLPLGVTLDHQLGSPKPWWESPGLGLELELSPDAPHPPHRCPLVSMSTCPSAATDHRDQGLTPLSPRQDLLPHAYTHMPLTLRGSLLWGVFGWGVLLIDVVREGFGVQQGPSLAPSSSFGSSYLSALAPSHPTFLAPPECLGHTHHLHWPHPKHQ